MRFVFDDYVLDSGRRELTRGEGPIAVGPQVFDLLLHLIAQRERVVSKDELLDVVWRGRIVSESTLTSHINAVRKAIGDSGDQQRLIRTIARRGFRFVGAVVEKPPARGAEPLVAAVDPLPDLVDRALVLPDRPSIVVLPFLNLSGDPAQEYFADGVVEDITSALSRLRWVFVSARNSAFVYRGRAVDVRQVGRELGVRYALEGSVRRAAERVRITGQLVDATTGGHLWADRFEGAVDDVFTLQDQVAESVVGAIAPQLERAEIERARRKPTNSLDAYDYYLRGLARVHQGTKDAMEAALPLFDAAMQLDPEYAAAHGMAAWCLFWRKVNGWTVDPAREHARGAWLARRAVDLGKDYDAVALTRGGHALAHFAGDLDGGIAWVDRALVLDPNHAPAWFLGGFLRLWRGEPELAIGRLDRAIRLSPLDSEMYRKQAGIAMAHLLAGRFEVAASWAERSARELPSFLMAIGILAASHAQAGRMDAARTAMRRLRTLDPTLRVSRIGDWLPLRRPEDLATFGDGLRKAGLPD